MVLLLGDERLESLRCSRCHKYLSVLPIENHSNGQVTCGRCSRDDDGGVRSLVHESVAEAYLFRCVNRYEGCKELLRANETAAHERKCIGKAFVCPKCKDGVERSVLQLIWHYKVDHPSSCLRGNRFVAKPKSEDVMLYVQEDVVFFISIRYVMNVLYLNTMTSMKVDGTQVFFINKGHDWKKIEKKLCMAAGAFGGNCCTFHLDSVEPIEVIFCLEVLKGDGTLPSISEDKVGSKKASTAPQQEFKIQLGPEFENKLGYKLNNSGTALLKRNGQEIDLNCSNCKQLIGRLLFRCVKLNHQICHNCRAWCGICNCHVISSTADDILNQVNCYLKYPCRWRCGGFYASDLNVHESTCKLRVLKCPMCPFEMDLSDFNLMKIHLADNHRIINFREKYDVQEIKSFIEQNLNSEISFMFHNRCCYLKWSYKGQNNYRHLCYDFTFGLFDNESNIKLGLIHNGHRDTDGHKDYSFSYNTSIKDCTVGIFGTYSPYINFNQTDE